MPPRPDHELQQINAFVPRVDALVGRRLGDGVAKATHSDEEKALHATLDYLLGALHSLQRAHALGYVDRPAPNNPPACESLRDVATAITAGQPPQGGEWLAGTTSIVPWSGCLPCSTGVSRIKHHQLLSNLHVKHLDGKAQTTWRDLWAVLEEVNGLKHEASGRWEGRTVSFSQALDAMEELLGILEEWDRSHR